MRSWVERHQVLAVSFAAGFCYVAWQLRSVLIVLLAGYILAAALRPAVDFLHRSVPRVLALLGVYVALIAAVFGIIVPTFIPLMGEAQELGQNLSTVAQSGILNESISTITQYLKENAFALTASGFTVIATAVSAFIISIYLLYDWHSIHHTLGSHASLFVKKGAEALRESEAMLGAWARGQLLLSAIVGVLVAAALIALGIDFAPVLGVFAGLTEFIPYAGPFLGAAPAVLVAFNESFTKAVEVGVAYLVIQQVEAHFLVPLVMRRSVNLHPVIVIASMLAGFELLGLAGIILAVPIAVIAITGVSRFWYG